MREVQLYVWYLSLAIQAVLLYRLIAFRRYAEWPWFTWYVGATLLIGISLVSLRKTGADYRNAWEAGQVVELILLAASGAEIYFAITGPRGRSMSLLVTAIIFFSGLATAALVSFPEYWPEFPVLEWMFVERGTVALILASGLAAALSVEAGAVRLVAMHSVIMIVFCGITAAAYVAMTLHPHRYLTGTVDTAGAALAFSSWAVAFGTKKGESKK